jgi:hypothetical protein
MARWYSARAGPLASEIRRESPVSVSRPSVVPVIPAIPVIPMIPIVCDIQYANHARQLARWMRRMQWRQIALTYVVDNYTLGASYRIEKRAVNRE